MACPNCGGTPTRKALTGPIPKYCSLQCKRAVARVRDNAAARSKRSERRAAIKCQWPDCGVVLDRGNKWCPEHATAKRRAQPRDSSTKTCTHADGCNRPARARGICVKHYARWLRAQGKYSPTDQWGDRRRNNAQARRALMKGAPTGGSVFLADVIARDGTDCLLCGQPVDMTLAWPHAMSKSVDHRTPLSLGGAHTMDNCQLAHMGCNASKGNRLPVTRTA